MITTPSGMLNTTEPENPTSCIAEDTLGHSPNVDCDTKPSNEGLEQKYAAVFNSPSMKAMMLLCEGIENDVAGEIKRIQHNAQRERQSLQERFEQSEQANQALRNEITRLHEERKILQSNHAKTTDKLQSTIQQLTTTQKNLSQVEQIAQSRSAGLIEAQNLLCQHQGRVNEIEKQLNRMEKSVKNMGAKSNQATRNKA